MNLSHRIQAKTDNGDLVIDFLVEVMQSLPRTRYGDERPDFKICHRLDAAKLLTRYGRDEAIDFILDNPPEPSRSRKSSGPSEESEFDIALAKKIRESTDDGVSVVRFLINVMQGDLKAFGAQHRMTAARELLSRGFGKHAREEAAAAHAAVPPSGPTTPAPDPAPHSSFPDPQPSFPRKRESMHSSKSESHTSNTDAHQQQPDPEEEQEDWARIWEEIEPIIEEAERISAEQPAPEIDPDNPPHVPDFSAFEEPPEPGPPTRSQHRRKLMFVLGESIYIDCDHPDCDLHEQDRSRFRGSVQYGAGPTSGHFP